MAVITMKELLEAGVHFGHQAKRRNPKMKKYIFGERNGIYIIDLQKTLRKFKEAYNFVSDVAAEGKRSFSSERKNRRRTRLPKSPAAAASITSTSAGWAAC